MKALLLLALLMTAGYTCAGNIELQIQITTQLTGRQASVILNITNTGSTPILDIQPRLHMSANNIDFTTISTLLPGKNHQSESQFSLPEQLINTNFFAPVYVTYRDRTDVRNTTVALANFRAHIDTPKLFAINLPSTNIGNGCNNVLVTLHRLDASDSEIRMRLITPPGIVVTPKQHTFSMSASNDIKITFQLCNETTLNNGRLPFHAIASTYHGNTMVEEAASAILHIKFDSLPERIFGNRTLVIWLAIGAFITLLVSGIFSLWRRF